MLGGDYIQRLLGAALAPIYEPAVLQYWDQSETRDPDTGSFARVMSGAVQVRAQMDECSEAMRMQPGYTAEDVRIMLLQHGSACSGRRGPTTDDRIVMRGQTWRIAGPVTQDPARVYWDCRCVRLGSA